MSFDKQQFIVHIRHSLEEMAFKDIIRASEGKSKMGAFILGSCFIEYLAGFRYGKETTHDDYKNFIKEFLGDKYDAEKLYEDLRCKLVHNYSEGGSYEFTDAKAFLHKQPINNKIILNLENFIDDLKLALNDYFKKLETSDELLQLAIKRYNKVGLIGLNRVHISFVNS